MNKISIIRFTLAGCFLLSILPFCFSQPYNFKEHIAAISKTPEYRKHTKNFLYLLDSLSVSKKEYFINECSQKAELYRNYGAYCYLNRDYQQAKSFFIDSARTHIQGCETIDKAIQLQVLTNIENLAFASQDDQLHDDIIRDLLDYIRKNEKEDSKNYKLIEANTKQRIAIYYRNIRDYDQATIFLNEALATYKGFDIKNSKPLRVFQELAIVNQLVGNFEESIKLNDQAIDFANELGIESFRYTTQLKLNTINSLVELDRFNEAKSLLAEAEKELKEKNFTSKLLLIPLKKADIEEAQGDTSNKIKYFLEVERLIQEFGTNVEKKNLFYYYTELSFLFQQKKDLVKAKNYALKALNISAINLSIENNIIDLSQSVVFEPQSFLSSANQYLSVMADLDIEPNKILNNFDLMDSLYFSIQPTLSGHLAKNDLADSYHKLAEFIVEYLFSNNLQDQYPNALAYYISNSKSKSLLSNSIFKSNVPEKIQSRFTELNKEKAKVESSLLAANKLENQQEFDSLAKLNFKLNSDIQEIYVSTNEQNLDIFYNKYRSSLLEEIMKSMDDDFLIDGIMKDSIFYCYAVSNQGYTFHQLNLVELDRIESNEIFTNINEYNNYISFIEDLSEKFKPVWPSDSKIQSIKFILDGALLNIPMELLQKDGKPVIESYSISYLNSFRDEELTLKNEKANRDYIGFGMLYDSELLDKIFDSYEIQKLYGKQYRLLPLRGAVEEIGNTEKLFSSKTFLNESCTRPAFLKHAESNQLLHITNHVLINENEPGLSSIVFGEGKEYDLIYAHEITGLNLNNNLAILSSCNSGVGENFTGNGIRSIGQSFFEAGSQSVLVNLWEAGDQSSELIISYFMKYIKEGKKKSEALKLAKLEFLAQAKPAQKHPKYWANLILIGNDNAITFHSSTWNYKSLAIALVVLLLLIFIFLLNKKRRTTKN